MIDRPETSVLNHSQLPGSRPTIGLMVHRITDSHGSALWSGITAAVKNLDVNLLCFRGNMIGGTDGLLEQGNSIYQLASADNVDGLIFSSATLATRITAEEMQRFADKYRAVPRVSLGLPLKGIPSITVENYEGMREMIAHLVETHGFRRIAFISGPSDHQESKTRYQAYVDALSIHGLPLNPALVSPPTEWLQESGREAVRILLDERGLQPGRDLEAIAASNDETALGAALTISRTPRTARRR
jgi:DNA-binding LacI/PurR family transcriptional regulator